MLLVNIEQRHRSIGQEEFVWLSLKSIFEKKLFIKFLVLKRNNIDKDEKSKNFPRVRDKIVLTISVTLLTPGCGTKAGEFCRPEIEMTSFVSFGHWQICIRLNTA